MKKSFGAVVLGAVLACGIAPASHAKVYTFDHGDNVDFIGFAPRGSFTDQFSFSLSGSSLVSGNFFDKLVNKLQLSFKAVSDSTWTPVTTTSATAVHTAFTLGGNPLSGGDYLFRISGTGVGHPGRLYAGALAVAPVPEPETWAMLSVGSVLVAYQLRRKQKALAQQPLAA